MISWVVALPDERAYIFSRAEDAGLIHTSLEQVVGWWVPGNDVELVLVTTENAPVR